MRPRPLEPLRARDELIVVVRCNADIAIPPFETRVRVQFVDTTADLKLAIAAREAERTSPRAELIQPPAPSLVDIRRDVQTQWLALIAEQGRAERQATQAPRASVLDLSGSVAAATASRTTMGETTTREQAQASWLIHRAEYSSSRESEPAVTAPEKGRAPTAHPDDDLAK